MDSEFLILKKKLLYRSKYRGVKELDLIFKNYIENYFHQLNSDDLFELNQLLEIPDLELLKFLLNPKTAPSNLKNKTFFRLLKTY